MTELSRNLTEQIRAIEQWKEHERQGQPYARQDPPEDMQGPPEERLDPPEERQGPPGNTPRRVLFLEIGCGGMI